MKTKETLFNLNCEYPCNISLVKLNGNERDWKNTIVIILGLEGVGLISVNNESFTLKKDNLILINSWDVFSISSENDFIYLETTIDISKINNSNNYIFNLNSTTDYNQARYNNIKEIIFSIVKENIKDIKYHEYISNSLVYSLIHILMNSYLKNTNNEFTLSKNLKVLHDVIAYIETNYKNNISLIEISSHFGYTPQYFSTFFKKNMNQNFQTYYDDFRINRIIKDVLNKSIPFEDITKKSGFNDYRSLVRAFKNKMGVTPLEYRKSEMTYFDEQTISEASRHYLDSIFTPQETKTLVNENKIDIRFNLIDRPKEITKTFQNVLVIDDITYLQNQKTRLMINEINQDIKYKYLCFGNTFSSNSKVIGKINGKIVYSFLYIDEVLDYILSLGLIPFIKLSYCPTELAKKNTDIINKEHDLPKNNYEWVNLILEFIQHIIKKYTLENVLLWKFAIWDSLDDRVNEALYYELYKETYRAIKGISYRFNVGSFTLDTNESSFDKNNRYLTYCKDSNIYPDFLCVSYNASVKNQYNKDELSLDPSYLNKTIKKLRDKGFYPYDKIYLLNFSFTNDPRNFLFDTIYSSCYLAKNILENMDLLDSFSYGTLTDFFNPIIDKEYMYHGGNGLITYNGIKKASYNTLKLLAKLDNYYSLNGDGYYITVSKDKTCIILYNYVHYNSMYAKKDYLGVDKDSRYNIFDMSNKNIYNIIITSLDYKKVKIKKTTIGLDSGSSYDYYIKYLNEELDKEELEDLANLTIPKSNFYVENIKNNTLELDVNLNSLEVVLLELKYLKD